MRMPGCAAVLGHRACPATLARYREARAFLRHAMEVLLILTAPTEPGVALPEGTLLLGAEDIFLPAYGAKSASRRIVPGNVDLMLLALGRARPGHARYWLIEYDVFFPAGPAPLLALEAAEADLLAAHQWRRPDSAAWPHWATLHCPGVPEERQLAAFLPLARYSPALLAAMESRYRAGWHGHCEALVPTVALDAGLRVAMLNAERGRPMLDARSFGDRRCGPVAPDYAYHPVKTEADAAALRTALGLRAWL